jgi:hypothetical protein
MPLIYKYLPPDRKTYLDNGLLRMTQPGDLNDPLECRSFFPDFDPVAIVLSDLEKNRRDYEETTGLSFNQISFEIHRQHRLAWAILPETKKNMFRDCYTSFASFLDSQLGVTSFSRKESSASMWEHYAGNHRGFCIGLEQEHYPLPDNSNEIREGIFYDVKYGSTRVPIEMTDHLTVKRNILFMKSDDFAYENETRVYYALESANVTSATKSERNFDVFLKLFQHTLVKEILIGKDAGPDLITKSRVFAEANHIPAFRMQPSTTGDLAMERGERIF